MQSRNNCLNQNDNDAFAAKIQVKIYCLFYPSPIVYEQVIINKNVNLTDNYMKMLSVIPMLISLQNKENRRVDELARH